MTPSPPAPGGDELRIRALLHARRARPFGHAPDPPQRISMPDRPITPSRIIPAGAPLPARPPEPGETPPWRIPPPTPPSSWPSTPPPPPGPIEVRVTLLPVPAPEPEPDPSIWARLWARIATRRMGVAILAALTPWAGGDSPVGLWSHAVHQARTEAGIPAAYTIAGIALAAAWALDQRTGRAVPRFLLVTASLGALGVLHWWDPIHLITGVDL